MHLVVVIVSGFCIILIIVTGLLTLPPPPHMASRLTSYCYPHKQLPICRAWNNNPRPFYPKPGSTYRHTCWHCYSNDHKAFIVHHLASPLQHLATSLYLCSSNKLKNYGCHTHLKLPKEEKIMQLKLDCRSHLLCSILLLNIMTLRFAPLFTSAVMLKRNKNTG